MKVIHKYELNMHPGVQTIHFTHDADVMSVQVQRGRPVLYVFIDLDDECAETKTIRSVMTGTELDIDDLWSHNYIGTAMLDGGYFVLHYFLM